jgi:hypothetical protein
MIMAFAQSYYRMGRERIAIYSLSVRWAGVGFSSGRHGIPSGESRSSVLFRRTMHGCMIQRFDQLAVDLPEPNGPNPPPPLPSRN